MRYEVLGPVRASRDDGTLLNLGSCQRRAVFAVLLLHANQPLSREQFIWTTSRCLGRLSQPAPEVRYSVNMSNSLSRSRRISATNLALTRRLGCRRYVDADPVAVAHSALLFEPNKGTAVIQMDLRDVASVLDSEVTRPLLDLERPIGLIGACRIRCSNLGTARSDPSLQAYGLPRAPSLRCRNYAHVQRI